MATARVLPSESWRVRMFVGMENGKKDYSAFYNMKISDIEQEHVQEVISSLAKTKSQSLRK